MFIHFLFVTSFSPREFLLRKGNVLKEKQGILKKEF